MGMNTYISIDAHNLFYRQINMTNRSLGVDNMIGMAFHLILSSMKKEYTKWNGTHVVMFLEGRSWRKDLYPQYKANRKTAYGLLSPQEQEDHKILTEAFNDFIDYIDTNTNISVLRNKNAEADDMVALWVESHPDDKHVLISSDSDFFQLLRHPNFTLYDPVKDILITRDGIFNDKGKRLSFTITSSAKIKVGKEDPNFQPEPLWYEYALFLKCIRGDSGDNILSAYPGVRERGTKKSVGIREAYEDYSNKGYSWNNFMLQKWVDHESVEKTVKDAYEFNKKLIDLSLIPDDIKVSCLETIATELERESVPASKIGISFMKFCGKWDLKKIGDNSADYMSMLKSKYGSQ